MNHFGIIDYIVVAGTLLVSVLIGVYYAVSSKHTNEDLLLGGRDMSIFPVAASVMVTYVSAITVLGFPAEIYSAGIQIFMIHIVSAVGFVISAFCIVPVFYRMKLTSINEYLEQRFESKMIRRIASFTFILQQVTVSGVVLYAPSIALETFLGLPVWMSVFGIGLCGTLYTSIFTIDPFMRHNFVNFLIGSGIYSIIQSGTHQLQVQRYSGMSSCKKARQVILLSIPLKIIVMGMCALTGISIYAVYADCDPIKLGKITKADQIVPYFVVNELAYVPGMLGLFTSCIFSAVLSSFSSSLNSLSAVTWEDFLLNVNYFKKMSPTGRANTTRFIGLLYGLLCTGLAFLAQNLGTIYSATIAAVGATSGALGGVFILGLFMPCVNAVGGIAGMLSSLTIMIIISIQSFIHKQKLDPLPTSIDGCQASDFYNTTFGFNSPSIATEFVLSARNVTESVYSANGMEDIEWYEKLFSLSYLLYAFVGALITVVVGLLVSTISQIFSKEMRKWPKKKHLHTIFRDCSFWCCKEPKDNELPMGSILKSEIVDLKSNMTGIYNPAFTKA